MAGSVPAAGSTPVDLDSLMAQVVDASPFGMMVIDDRGVILFANREAERVLATAESQLDGRLSSN